LRPPMTKLTQMSIDKDDGGEFGLNSRRIHLREISGDSESPLETVGQDLRAARLRRGDEIAEVSRALKIRKGHLEALEEDRLEDLPGKTYAIGFVRSYARYLGLDSLAYVERFKRDISGRAEEQSREPAPIHQDEGRRLPNGWRVIAAAVVILLVWGTWRLLSSGNESTQTVPPAPALNTPKPVFVAPKPAMVTPSQATTSPPTANSAVAAPRAEATPAPPPAADGANKEQPEATPTPPPAADGANKEQPEATPTPAAGAKTPETSTAAAGTSPTPPVAETSAALVPTGPAAGNGTGTVYGTSNQNPRVVLKAHGEARVTVRGPDGQIYINRDLKAGDSYLVPNNVGLTLATSNAGQLEVDLDGTALGRAGLPEQILGRVSLDPQSLADRFNNH
jgi:cytoskeleton protein RodZ